jgi:hypothetical protein
MEGSLRSLLALKSRSAGSFRRDSHCNAVSGGVTLQEPSAVAGQPGLEAISALPGTEGISPGIVPDETKFSVTDSAALRCAISRVLSSVEHIRLLRARGEGSLAVMTVICRRGIWEIPTAGIIAVALNLFGRDRGHFCHLQSALPDW